MIEVNMGAAEAYRTEHYGVLLVSATVHTIRGRGVHNPSFNHSIEVWANRNGSDPFGTPTAEEFTVMMNAQPSVISASPVARPPQGEHLSIGDEVRLTVNGYPVGEFRIEAAPLRDPILVRINA